MKIECTPTGTWIVRQSYNGQSLVAIAPSRAEALGALIDLIDAHRRISTPSEAVAHLCEEERSRTAEHYGYFAKEAQEQKLRAADLTAREAALRVLQEAASRIKNIEPSEGEK